MKRYLYKIINKYVIYLKNTTFGKVVLPLYSIINSNIYNSSYNNHSKITSDTFLLKIIII